MTASRLLYDRRRHGAAWTTDYLFAQLIPYIGNKRKLLGLIGAALDSTGVGVGGRFLDLFAGSGVVSRWARLRGLSVVANDWEPYAEALNRAWIGCDHAPAFRRLCGYEAAITSLNQLTPIEGWITRHLCPSDDDAPDGVSERLFYMRKNGMRIDAIRACIDKWLADGLIDGTEEACLLAPLLYQACYTSNTSGVFKGFHNGWGGRTGTALYRIASDLVLQPIVFHSGAQPGIVSKLNAAEAAARFDGDVAYLDPPYNQHPYGSNYHVLNTITLWDSPPLSPRISRRDKAAIRLDWRTERRSPFNHRREAAEAYRQVLAALRTRFVLTSYSTDGMIPVEELVAASAALGATRLFAQPYKRYRVSTQRFSPRPRTVEFVLVTERGVGGGASVSEIVAHLRQLTEAAAGEAVTG